VADFEAGNFDALGPSQRGFASGPHDQRRERTTDGEQTQDRKTTDNDTSNQSTFQDSQHGDLLIGLCAARNAARTQGPSLRACISLRSRIRAAWREVPGRPCAPARRKRAAATSGLRGLIAMAWFFFMLVSFQ
jgi:hypothetical protein